MEDGLDLWIALQVKILKFRKYLSFRLDSYIVSYIGA